MFVDVECYWSRKAVIEMYHSPQMNLKSQMVAAFLQINQTQSIVDWTVMYSVEAGATSLYVFHSEYQWEWFFDILNFKPVWRLAGSLVVSTQKNTAF